jgi:hypothetical protein
MNNDMLVASSIGLLPISAMILFQAAQYQFSKNKKIDENTATFAWGIFLWSFGIFSSCIFYLLWDFDIITKAVQYKLSVIPRFTFLIGSIFFYNGLNRQSNDNHLFAFFVILLTFITFSVKVIG